MYTPIQPSRLYAQIVEQIKAQILNGQLRAGDQLPTERALSEQFGVSRTAVREAITALGQRGLVEVRPGRGTFVINGASQAVRDSLELLMKIGQEGDDRINLVEVREILEPEIAALAAKRAGEAEIAEMQEAITVMDTMLDDIDAFIAFDNRFHRALAKATHNPIILTLFDSIVDLLHEQRRLIGMASHGPEHGQYHHKQILATIVDSDPEAARQAMRAHLQQVREDIRAATKP
jgi:GntR family transcriptional repressor for pyruvate dehydrogenase complex